MPTHKVPKGKDIIRILQSFQFQIQSQKGSHIKLFRVSGSGQKQVLIIPNHVELDVGTIKAIYRQSLKYISEEELFHHFYNS